MDKQHKITQLVAEIAKVKGDVENCQRGYITKYEAVQRLSNLIDKR